MNICWEGVRNWGAMKASLPSSSIYISGYEAYALTGLECGVGEPVLGHKDCGDVSLVVNEFRVPEKKRLF